MMDLKLWYRGPEAQGHKGLTAHRCLFVFAFLHQIRSFLSLTIHPRQIGHATQIWHNHPILEIR